MTEYHHLTLTVLGYFCALKIRGGGGPSLSHLGPKGADHRENLACASEIVQRERPQCYFSQILHILLVIIYANHLHRLCVSL